MTNRVALIGAGRIGRIHARNAALNPRLQLVAVVDPAFVPVADPSEVADVFEVPLAFLMDPANLRKVG